MTKIKKGFKFPKVLIAPNGKQKIAVYPDGYTKFLGEWTDEQKEVLHDAMQTAANTIHIFDPYTLYKKAGWKDMK